MTSPALETWQATPADAPVVAPLFDAYRQFYEQPADPVRALEFIGERLARGESVIFLAGRAGKRQPLGFVQLYPSFSSVAARRIWILNDLYVAPEGRRLGVGRCLMEAARRHAVGTGAKRLMLSTALTNTPAQALYESLGYKQVTKYLNYSLELD